MIIRRLREAERAALILRDLLAEHAPKTLDFTRAGGCRGCGAWLADVRTWPTAAAPHGEAYCWRCVRRKRIPPDLYLPIEDDL